MLHNSALTENTYVKRKYAETIKGERFCLSLFRSMCALRKMVLFAMLMIYIWQFMGAFRPQFGPDADQAKVVVMQRGG